MSSHSNLSTEDTEGIGSIHNICARPQKEDDDDDDVYYTNNDDLRWWLADDGQLCATAQRSDLLKLVTPLVNECTTRLEYATRTPTQIIVPLVAWRF